MKLSTRLTVAMVALVAVTSGAVGMLTYSNAQRTALPRALERIDTHASLLAAQLEASVRGARGDVAGFRAAVAVDGIIRASLAGGAHSTDGITVTQWSDRLAARFSAELVAKSNYAELRVIGIRDGGREIVRVERREPRGPVRVVRQEELQREAEQRYFQESIKLQPGEIYVSPIELNRENGAIEVPYVPVLHIAAPVFAPDGSPFGIVIVTVDLRSDFAQVSAAEQTGATIYVVNERGDYLLHPDSSRTFGFEFGKPYRLQDDFPDLAGLPALEDAKPRVSQRRDGERFGAALASVQLAGGPRIAIVEIVPYARILAATQAVRDASLFGGLAATLVAMIVAFFVARSLTRPLEQMTRAVEGFAGGGAIAVPTHAGGEIGVLARAFERMATEVREKTAALTKEIEERRSIFENSLDLILIVDRQGTFLRVSPSSVTILRIKPEDMVGRSATEFIHPDDLENTRVEMRRSRRGREMRNFECRYMHADGHAVTLAWTGVWSEPEQRHFFIGRDMTESLKLAQQLRQSQKMDAIGQLTGGVAHDFNNILTVITGTIEVLAEGVAGRPQLAAIAKMIDEAATRGADLTNHLLAFARKQPLQPRATDVNALIVDTARLLRPTLGEQIEIEAMLPDDAWPAMIDPVQLSTAIINLAVNARDAMPDGGKLTLETRNVRLDEAYARDNADVTPGPYVMVAVSDTGCGIPAELRDRVFEPFFTTKEIGKGTGLGLSMVYGFVKQSNGHIKIYSEEGHGTTIKVYLPKLNETVEAALAPREIVAMPGGGETVLVVEDDSMVRNYVIAQLLSLGYQTLAAANATEALVFLKNGDTFDLLFTDVIMPGGLNGRQLADEMIRRRPSLKVLYTSGYTENAIVHHGRLDQGVALLNKPYRKADLARKIREVLGSAPA
jgi:PAS domain S-box-containing protein